MDYIMPELLIGIPFLVGVGKFIKSVTSADNRWIPLILGIVGVVFAPALILVFGVIENGAQAVFMGIVQGVIIAAVAVFGHTVFKICCGQKDKKWSCRQRGDFAVIYDSEAVQIADSYDTDLLQKLVDEHNNSV
jgi:hypothetical protein